jgi:hypothetical protein
MKTEDFGAGGKDSYFGKYISHHTLEGSKLILPAVKTSNPTYICTVF